MLSAIDFLRKIGWAIVDFIYSFIDTLFSILKELNLYDIVDSISENTIFSNFHSGIIAISVTLLALFIAWRFLMKVLEPNDSLSTNQIVIEIVKCSLLVFMSVFLFAQANTFSIKLSGYTSSMFNAKGGISNYMLKMYVDYADGYKASKDFKDENITNLLSDKKFKDKEMYNDKYVTPPDWVKPNEKDYKYSINWIMAILVGGFFLYTLLFSGMMLARRQIEFLFLFLISPIIFATSIGNKQRRSAVIEQLVSLILQGAVIMLIISLTVLVMQAVNSTTFFSDSTIKDMAVKSLMFVGCGTFLLTGSQIINRFIGANVSANSGRDQFMSLMSYGNIVKTATNVGVSGITGAGSFGLGVASSTAGHLGGNKVVNTIGNSIQKFGNQISTIGASNNGIKGHMQSGIGNTIEKFGSKVKNSTPSNLGKNMRAYGKENMSNAVSNAVNSVIPNRAYNTRRYKSK